MTWHARKHSDKYSHEARRIMPRRWGEILILTHPICGPDRKRLAHACICVCVYVFLCLYLYLHMRTSAYDLMKEVHIA